jgi:hypothetical protein
MDGAKEQTILSRPPIDLFLQDWDESMSVDGVETLADAEFQEPIRIAPLFSNPY